jgi:AraC-like DNA-binding protein
LKSALQKSPIPSTHAFLIRSLEDPMFDPTWHFHAEYQLFTVLKGRGTRFIGDNISPFKDGDLTFTGPNLPHLWQSTMDKNETQSKGVVVYFKEDIFSDELLHKEESIKIKQFLKKSLRGIEVSGDTSVSVQKMLVSLLELKGFDRVLQLLKIIHVLSESEDVQEIASAGYTNSLKGGDTARMNRVYTHVMNNFKRKIAISELAELTNMTTTSFSRYFKVHANKTFSEFLTEIRIGHACKILIEDKIDISSACYESGFQTLSNFNHQFKKITKRTPLAYRKEYEMT